MERLLCTIPFVNHEIHNEDATNKVSNMLIYFYLVKIKQFSILNTLSFENYADIFKRIQKSKRRHKITIYHTFKQCWQIR